MNLFLHGIEDFHIERGATLANPAFTEGDRLHRFDVILANPPYSIKAWDRDAWSSDPWGRNRYGTPPQGRADYAFWQHILASMDRQTGRCAVLFPHGVLFRDEERDMRQKIISADVVEAVIGLGPNLFYNSPMEACIVICRSKKAADRAGKVLLIDAVNEVTRERAQSFLTPTHIDRIVTAYRSFIDDRGFAALATHSKITERGMNLALPQYVQRNAQTERQDLSEALTMWRTSSYELKIAVSALSARLDAGGVV